MLVILLCLGSWLEGGDLGSSGCAEEGGLRGGGADEAVEGTCLVMS